MIIIPKHIQKRLKEVQNEEGAKFVRDRIYQIAHAYYKKIPDVKELWILICAKRDSISGNINCFIRAADKGRKHEIDKKIQGGQFWYTNQTTGELRLEWILPLSLPKQKDSLKRVSEGNKIIEANINQASKEFGIDLLTGETI
jgi:hypothetical protein